MATAASNAFPPAFRISIPARVASGCAVLTMPAVPTAGTGAASRAPGACVCEGPPPAATTRAIVKAWNDLRASSRRVMTTSIGGDDTSIRLTPIRVGLTVRLSAQADELTGACWITREHTPRCQPSDSMAPALGRLRACAHRRRDQRCKPCPCSRCRLRARPHRASLTPISSSSSIRPPSTTTTGTSSATGAARSPATRSAACNSLTEDAIRSGEFGRLDVRVEVIDEIVPRVDPAQLGRRYRRPDTKVVVGLVGVQTNQFPRAQDLAAAVQGRRASTSSIGGFHVSGAMAMAADDAARVPGDDRRGRHAGARRGRGPVGRHPARRRVRTGSSRSTTFSHDLPDLTDKPAAARVGDARRGGSSLQNSGTIDAGRGCPFNCSFCTIINVQGQTMRCAQRRAHPRPDPRQLLSAAAGRRASATTSSPTTTSPATRSGRRSSTA